MRHIDATRPSADLDLHRHGLADIRLSVAHEVPRSIVDEPTVGVEFGLMPNLGISTVLNV